jgi:hypothetical protein
MTVVGLKVNTISKHQLMRMPPEPSRYFEELTQILNWGLGQQ